MSWDRISPEELAIAEPVVQSSANPGVEVLFRDTAIDESDRDGSRTRTHVRLKVFDERGVQAVQKIDIYYDAEEERVSAIGARVIKPDGTIIEVGRDAFYTRKLVRNRYLKFNVVTFTPPGLEPGVIVEYKVSLQGDLNYGGFQYLQDEFPTRVLRFRVKPPPVPRLKLLSIYHRYSKTPMVPDTDGYYGMSLELMPGAINEPLAPPDAQVRAWIAYYYVLENPTAEKFWADVGRSLHSDNEKLLKPTAPVQKACATILAGAKTDLEKIERIEVFCRTQIRNISGDASGFTVDEIARLKPNKGPADTLANKYGNGADLQYLYVALARAAGFDARLARCSDRSRMAFDAKKIIGFTAPDQLVAINVSGIWWFAQPNVPYLPFGFLHWTNEGETALVADPKTPPFAKTLASAARGSQSRRTARLALSEDGTLEGDVEILLTGHLAVQCKEDYDDETPGGQADLVRAEVMERLPAAEVTAISLDNITGQTGPVTIKYHLRVPDYAQVTGQRLFVQPAVFEVGTPAMFTADERKHPIFFGFQSSEQDDVVITLPAGVAIESVPAPAALPDGSSLHYQPKLTYHKAEHHLVYERRFELKLRNVPPEQYAGLREMFDHIHEEDARAVSLRRSVAAVPGN